VTQSFRRYKHAPITEAVIEIRVQPIRAERSARLAELAGALKETFPKQAPIQMLHFGVAAAPNAGNAQVNQVFSQSALGFRLANAGDTRVVQLRSDGFAYSHLQPYSEWSTFRGEAKPLWDRYRENFPDLHLQRCGLRYINRIDIPAEKIDIFEYFRFYPEIPKQLAHQDVVSMALNVQMPQTDLECMAVIIQALIEPPRPGVISVVLDIDLFRLNIESWQDVRLWQFLDALRIRKNEIFEACITDRTRALID